MTTGRVSPRSAIAAATAAVAALTMPGPPCCGQGAPAAGAPPSPAQVVRLVCSARNMREAARLLADKLHLAVVVAEPPARAALAGAMEPQGPGSQHGAGQAVPLRFEERPLSEVLDAVAAAFGYAWEEALGIYVFRPRPSVQAAGERIILEVQGRAELPPEDARKELVAALDAAGIGERSVPVGLLDARWQAIVRRMLFGKLLGDFQRALTGLSSSRSSLPKLERLTLGAFAGTGRVFLSPPADDVIQLRIEGLSPGKGEASRGMTWGRTRPRPVPPPAGRGGPR